ncbi:MAPEG family protein [Xanthomonadaceae bacterium JHOS43]|nr:MAPEG family protein [Xanthomonadaceae bacterium JHOS43]MCX7561956.1 MAPEG family protein [Xanthomonadaceae bacterium XH05]
MNPWVALVVWSTVCLLLATTFIVGRARARYGVKAPAISGHPEFERAYRVQMNTIEQAIMFLPAFLLAASLSRHDIACVLGAIWLLGRIGYIVAYLRNPASRGPAFVIAMLAFAGLLIQSAWGIAWRFMLS